jgi:hypothetical protein
MTRALVVGIIVLLIVGVVVVMLLVITFGHLSWRARGSRPFRLRAARDRLARNQREAAATVRELRDEDHYGPDSPRLDEDEL